MKDTGSNSQIKSVNDLKARDTCPMEFQPIVRSSGEVYGFEALLRGQNGTPCNNPDELFARKECQEDLFDLDLSCIVSELQSAHMVPRHCFHFINITAPTVEYLSINSDIFLEFLEDLDVDPRTIVFEIFEKTDYKCVSSLMEFLGDFVESGIRIAIDDVGPSFKWLHHMLGTSPAFLKVDRTMVKDIHKLTSKQSLVRGLNLIAKKNEDRHYC